MKRKQDRKNEKGIALLFVLLAIMLLSAIAVGMLYTATIETGVSSNFKTQEKAYFAARGGVEEVRDRLLQNEPNSIYFIGGNPNLGTYPMGHNETMPGAGPNGVIYILNGVTMADVTTPPAPGAPNPYFDDEFCHDYFGNGIVAWQPSNVACTTTPGGAGWYTTVNSTAPYAGTNAALEFKWVRIALKENASDDGGGTNVYYVNNLMPATTPVCWTGTSQITLPAGYASCDAYPQNLGGPYGPVYVVTALAVTSSLKNVPGARRLVQFEVGQSPVVGAKFGAFAVSANCAAMKFAGNASTGSFNSAAENPPTVPPSNLDTSNSANGNIGANGNNLIGGTSTDINGTVGTASGNNQVGACPDGLTITGKPEVAGQDPATVCPPPAPPAANNCPIDMISPQSFPVPPQPNPMPPTTNVKYTKSTTITPGSYGNVSVTAGSTLTLTGGTPGSPAVYTLNSLSLAGGSTIAITGPVILNFGGQGVTTVIDMTGGGFSNPTGVASNFVINYGGPSPCPAANPGCTPSPQSGTGIAIAGGSDAFAVVNTPRANVKFTGGSNFYGQVVGNTVDDQGGTNLYYDTSLSLPPSWNSPFHPISFRELSY
jgi:hypothetical protein